MANQSDLSRAEQWLIESEETDCFDDPGQKLLEAGEIIADLLTAQRKAKGQSFDEYQQLAELTAKITKKLPQILYEQMRFINFGMGLAGEAGEVVDYLKKVVFHGHSLDKDKLKKELGDCLWYIATLANTAGLDLSEVAAANIEKLRNRYPEGFDPARSIHRAEVSK